MNRLPLDLINKIQNFAAPCIPFNLDMDIKKYASYYTYMDETISLESQQMSLLRDVHAELVTRELARACFLEIDDITPLIWVTDSHTFFELLDILEHEGIAEQYYYNMDTECFDVTIGGVQFIMDYFEQ